MDLFDVLSLIGGLAIFLFGLNVMGTALEKQAGGRLKGILEKLTSSPIKGLVFGAIVTAIIQSSSATTVMVVGFVNSGLMRLSQAIGIIMGANIGTTATSWILSLTAIEGDSIFVKMLKPSSFAPILAAIGISFFLFTKNERKKNLGTIFLGFTVLMTGMDMMGDAVKPLADVPEFAQLFVMFENPVLGVLVGALLTAAIQSSSASVGILQALSLTGSITFGSAIPIIMGQNIGTCVTAMLASIGAGKNARRSSFVHLYFNLIGTILFLIIFYGIHYTIGFNFFNDIINAGDIAVVHTIFNIVTTALLFPFTKALEKLACLTVKDDEEFEEFQVLDLRLMATPTVAVDQCKTVCEKMAKLSSDVFSDSANLLKNYNEELFELITDKENKVDLYQDKIETFLIQLSEKNLTHEDNTEISKILHCVGDFERISDHATKIASIAQEITEKEINFTKEGDDELDVMVAAVKEILEMTMQVFVNNDIQLAEKIEPLEEVIDLLKSTLKSNHIERLKKGKCSTDVGFIFSSLISNLERISDHCSNVAVCLIEIGKNKLSTHEYINELKRSEDKNFEIIYNGFKEKYKLR